MSKILIDKSTVKLALEALNTAESDYGSPAWERGQEAITALREALTEQPAQQEPVARQYQGRDGVWRDFINEKHCKDTLEDGSWPIRDLYTSPPAPVPLTDEQMPPIPSAYRDGVYLGYGKSDFTEYARAIEAAHGIKENT